MVSNETTLPFGKSVVPMLYPMKICEIKLVQQKRRKPVPRLVPRAGLEPARTLLLTGF